MQSLTIRQPNVTIRDYISFAAQELGLPVPEVLAASDIIFPLYREAIYYFLDYFYEMFGIEIRQLNNYTIHSNFGITNYPEGVTPGDAYRYLIFNNKTDQAWRTHPSKLPNDLRLIIARSSWSVPQTPEGNVSTETKYFLYWCYLNYQVSPHGREFFSMVNPFWPELQKQFLEYNIDSQLKVKEGRAQPGSHPVAVEMSEYIIYEIESYENGAEHMYLDYAWVYDQDWVTDMDDPEMPLESYFKTYGMTYEQARYRLELGWIPYPPKDVHIIGDVNKCVTCGNSAGCTTYLSEYGDFLGERDSMVKCDFCSHDDKVEMVDIYNGDTLGAKSIHSSCPAQMLYKYLDSGLTDELVYHVVALKMVDDSVVKTFPEALRLTQEKFNVAPSIVRAFAIKLLKENHCIKRKLFYNCNHITKNQAMLWTGLLNMEMAHSVNTLGGSRVQQLNTRTL